MRNNQAAQFIGKSLLVILWMSMLIVGILWVSKIKLPFDPSSVTFLLGLVSTAVTVLVNVYNRRLAEEEYSTAYALADGYFNNFLEPALTRLIGQHGNAFTFLIYIPEQFGELSKRAIDRTIARLHAADFSSDVINLELEEGRARDLLTILGHGENCYFDFPNTLLTLKNLVDYKVGSEKEQFNEKERDEKSREYIQQFKARLMQQLEKHQLSDFVTYTDSRLQPFIQNNSKN
jgi:hypothetical protein